MNHVTALKKLIERNVSFVQKKGTTAYSRETDDIINALLQFVADTETDKNKTKNIETNRDTCFELFGIPDEFKSIDNEFLSRYLKFDVVDGFLIENNFAQSFEITPGYILAKYKNITQQIDYEFELYHNAKENGLINPENYNRWQDVFPEWYKWFKSDYSYAEVKQDLKQKMYYHYERTTR